MYTCPMHPEVRADTPGRCPKCGMALVVASSLVALPKKSVDDKGLGPLTWRSYLPLIVIFSILLLATFVLSWTDMQAGLFSVEQSIVYFMTGFFLVFSGFKLLDLPGFAEGYATYDLLAERLPAYGYLYPFIELSFGLAMLVGVHNPSLLWIEVGVMLFSGVGVVIKIARREPVHCVCLGTVLKVPLTYITLIEDFGMAALALLVITLQ
ncbi:MAG: heavy metal-binding domain-containing protein [Patescibacteria group bacterium]